MSDGNGKRIVTASSGKWGEVIVDDDHIGKLKAMIN